MKTNLFHANTQNDIFENIAGFESGIGMDSCKKQIKISCKYTFNPNRPRVLNIYAILNLVDQNVANNCIQPIPRRSKS
jgi:hypothetical protein